MAIKLVLVGAGNMGFAMLAGWLKAGKLEPEETLVVEPNDGLRERAARLAARWAPGRMPCRGMPRRC
jgi:pyrroline-5-carboxylate reductase